MNLNDLSTIRVIRRNGEVVGFDAAKIRNAIALAYLKDADGEARHPGDLALSASEREKVERFTEQVVAALLRHTNVGAIVRIEDIQDQVELALMRAGEHDVARDYVLYRARRAAVRNSPSAVEVEETKAVVDGANQFPATKAFVMKLAVAACAGIAGADPQRIAEQAWRDIYDGITRAGVDNALLLAARSLIETDPAYDRVTARCLLALIRAEVLGSALTQEVMEKAYAEHFVSFVVTGVEAERLDPRLLSFDLSRLGLALDGKRDLKFRYLGLQTLYDRYFLHVEERRIELPQSFLMRVAMGLALDELDKENRAIEFYEVLSNFDFMNSTPTLFNSGTVVPQLSSCYLTTVPDDLDGIYQAIKENALLQKYAGGLGNDWTPVRAMGSWIKGTNGRSQGVIPFLKVANDTAVAVNQGGKRKGAVCAYLETWHLDIEEFLDLRKNVGDDRRRTHDMNTANWIPDLFMKRVMEDGEWTLFTPVDVPDLHEKYGKAFEEAYVVYESMAARGEIKLFKKVSAMQLWRKVLAMLFETGHPWITFKDACNVRSPQQHAGWYTAQTCVSLQRRWCSRTGTRPHQ
jgi:ribonucleoside-diphosphate reductase alpha chain